MEGPSLKLLLYLSTARLSPWPLKGRAEGQDPRTPGMLVPYG